MYVLCRILCYVHLNPHGFLVNHLCQLALLAISLWQVILNQSIWTKSIYIPLSTHFFMANKCTSGFTLCEHARKSYVPCKAQILMPSNLSHMRRKSVKCACLIGRALFVLSNLHEHKITSEVIFEHLWGSGCSFMAFRCLITKEINNLIPLGKVRPH